MDVEEAKTLRIQQELVSGGQMERLLLKQTG